MKEQIRINYERLANQSRRLTQMADSLGRCRTAVERTGNTLAGMKGAAADAIAGRRMALLALIDELISDTEDAKQWLNGYENSMNAILEAANPSSDLVVDKWEFWAFIQHLKRQIDEAYTPAGITPTSQQYLEYYTHSDRNGSWTETKERYDLYHIEEENGYMTDALRGAGLTASRDACLSIVSRIEQTGMNSIDAFFNTDAELAAKLPSNIPVPAPHELSRFVSDYSLEYAKLMPGGKPDFEYLKKLMATTNPNDLKPAQIAVIKAMFEVFDDRIQRIPDGNDAHIRAWAEKNLLGFFEACCIISGISNPLGYPHIPSIRDMIEGRGREHSFRMTSTAEYIIRLFVMDCLSGGKPFLNFQPDVNQGIFYTPPGTVWQSYLGYSHMYDLFFSIGTQGNMNRGVFNFPMNVKIGDKEVPMDFAFWSWKGDYLVLGAGAETGFYLGIPGVSAIPGVGSETGKISGAFADERGSFPMTLELKTKDGETIFKREPEGEETWITGFKPGYQTPKPEDLIAVTTVDFDETSEWDMSVYDAFKAKYGDDERLDFDKHEDEHKVIITV